MDLSEHLDLFLTESRDHLEQARRQLRGGDAAELFRHLHSLKGMAAMMQFSGLADLCHRLEERLGPAADPDLSTAAQGDIAAGLDEAGTLLDAIGSGQTDPRPTGAVWERCGDTSVATPGSAPIDWLVTVRLDPEAPLPAARALVICRQLQSFGTVRAMRPNEARLRAGAPPTPIRFLLRSDRPPESIRTAVATLADVKSSRVGRYRHPQPQPVDPPIAAALPESVRLDRVQLDRLLETAADIGIERLRLAGADAARPDSDHHERLRRAVDRLWAQVMEMRLVPFGSIADRLKDGTLELARRRGKRVEIEIRGAAISLDRSTLDRLLDPLQHLLRNCVDHGIEPPAERLAAGKDPVGRLQVTVSRSGPELDLVLRDDGRGIDPEQIRRRAVAGGWMTSAAAARLDRAALLRLITQAGLSTAEQTDEVSGRGVGMDVVATRIAAMGGSLQIDSRPRQGTTFRIRLPLTVAVLDGLLVRAGTGWFALPLHQVMETVREPGDGDSDLTIVPLAGLLGTDRPDRPTGSRPVLVVEGAAGPFGLAVDAILGKREFVLRPLGRPLQSLPEITAAAILDTGRIALLLNARSLEPAF